MIILSSIWFILAIAQINLHLDKIIYCANVTVLNLVAFIIRDIMANMLDYFRFANILHNLYCTILSFPYTVSLILYFFPLYIECMSKVIVLARGSEVFIVSINSYNNHIAIVEWITETKFQPFLVKWDTKKYFRIWVLTPSFAEKSPYLKIGIKKRNITNNL